MSSMIVLSVFCHQPAYAHSFDCDRSLRNKLVMLEVI